MTIIDKLWPFQNMEIGRLDVDLVMIIDYEIKGLPGYRRHLECYVNSPANALEIGLLPIDLNLDMVIIKDVKFLGAYKDMFPGQSVSFVEITRGYYEYSR